MAKYRTNNKECECCHQLVELECHHWYQPPALEYHHKYICRNCNMKLTTENVWGFSRFGKTIKRWNHILPKWELQQELANTTSKKDFLKIRGIIKEEYRDFVLLD